MNEAAATCQPEWTYSPVASLDASDEFNVPEQAPYCPTDLLATFVDMMTARDRPVSMQSMLVDREYAMWQLARAHTMGDESLRAIAARLFAYFDDLDHARTAH
ncbi:MAG: hypothetical protein Q8R63_09830 [Ramlibacter sp.]|nr:hypothetical protein [Ramlibacter sp.]